MSYSITKNASFLTFASIFQKIISFVYFTIIARMVGVENTGVYFFALAFTAIFAVVADFGLSPILTRESAKYPDKTGEYLNTVFWTKLVFGFLTYLLVVFTVNALKYPPLARYMVYLSGVTMIFDNIHSVFYGVFRGRKNLVYESIGVVSSQFITLLVGTTAMLLRWPLVWLIIAYAIPSFLNAVYSGFFVWKRFGIFPKPNFSAALLKNLLILSFPFALSGILSRLYSYTDSMLMSKMLAPKELGWWSVPYKITFAFQFIPVALSASVYPAMSSYTVLDRAKIGTLFEKSWRYLFTVAFPVAFGIMAISSPVIIFLYGPAYAPAVGVLRLLLVSLIFTFLAYISSALLNATDNQKKQTGLLGVALLANLTLNFVLLPRLGIKGAAVASLASNFLMCLGGYVLARRYVEINGGRIFKYFNQTFWPAVLMGIAVYALSLQVHFLIAIPFGAVLYFGLLFFTGGLSREMIKENWNKLFTKYENS